MPRTRPVAFSCALAMGLAAACSGSAAADLFRLSVSVGTQTGTAAYTTAERTFDGLRDTSLSSLVPAYTGTQSASAVIDYRGLALTAAYPVDGSPLLVLTIPSLGINQNFNGGTREESRRLLRDYFRNGDTLDRIFRALAATSPVDPLAGNPASLQSRMVAGSYARHFVDLVGSLSATAPVRQLAALRPVRLASAEPGLPAMAMAAQAPSPAFAAGVDVARLRAAGLKSTLVTLPLRYMPDIAPDRPLSVDLELQAADTQGAKAAGGQIGTAWRTRMNDGWFLVPALNVGLAASSDLGAAGGMLSASLTSALRLHQQAGFSLWMGNAVHALRSLKVSAGDYRTDPRLRNTAFANGLVLSTTPSQFSLHQWLELSVTDTRYTGSRLYDRRYDEIGLALVRVLPAAGMPAMLRTELRYIDTTNTRGWGLRFQATF